MKKEIITTNKNSKLTLAKSKNLMNIADKILAKKTSKHLVEDESWMEKLWEWADKNIIPNVQWVKEEDFLPYVDENLIGLPRERDMLISLTNLNLNDCDICYLPKEIGKLSELTKLDLSNNNLTELPEEIYNLRNLTNFDLSNNNLTELHESIWKLSYLEDLNLSYNNFTKAPEAIRNLYQLDVLDLSGNDLTRLPKEIQRLCLEHLYIYSTKLNNHRNQFFKELNAQLKELEEDGCEIHR